MIVIDLAIIMCDSIVREAGMMPLGEPLIFIDKFNISGIEMMILDEPAGNQLVGNLLARRRYRRTILIFIVEGLPRLDSLRRRVDSFERP